LYSFSRSPFCTNAGPSGHASRLCKFGFHFRFKQLAAITENPQLTDGIPTYLGKKLAASDYQAAKQQLWKQLEADGYGCWLKKPDELEKFY
jgi:Adenosine-deaminase (editase) domain